ESPDPIVDRPRERSAYVPKELTLKELPGDRRTVDLDQGPTGTRAALVNGSRDQLLAGAGLALQEHVRLGRRNQIHLTQHAVKGLALADYAINWTDPRR